MAHSCPLRAVQSLLPKNCLVDSSLLTHALSNNNNGRPQHWYITPEHFTEQKMVSGRSDGKDTCPQGHYGVAPVSLCPSLLWASLHSSALFLILTFFYFQTMSILTLSLTICLLLIKKYFQIHGFILVPFDFYEVMDKSELIINGLVTNLCQIK